jgi:hypothetical protein
LIIVGVDNIGNLGVIRCIPSDTLIVDGKTNFPGCGSRFKTGENLLFSAVHNVYRHPVSIEKSQDSFLETNKDLIDILGRMDLISQIMKRLIIGRFFLDVVSFFLGGQAHNSLSLHMVFFFMKMP